MDLHRHNSLTQLIIASLVFLIALAVFTINTIHLGFGFGVEESRYILFAQEMFRHGLTPFPLLYGQPYPDYPAFHTVLIYLFSLLFHQVTPLSSILPSAIACAAMLFFTYRIAAKHSTQWGIYACLFLVATYEFLLLARIPSPDPIVAAVTSAGFYLCHTKTFSKTLTLSFLAFGILGFLVRGPMGLVIPALVVSAYYFFDKQYRAFFTITGCSILLLGICSLLELFVAQQTAGTEFAKQVFFMEVGGRFSQLGQRPFYYYFVNSFGGYAVAFPLAILTVITYAKQFFSKNENPAIHLLKQATGWAFIILLLLSFPHEKHFRYIISAAPAFALIASYSFVTEDKNLLLKLSREFLLTLCKTMPILGLIAAGLSFFSPLKDFNVFNVASLILFAALSVAVLFFSQKTMNAATKQLILFSIGVASLLVFFINIAQPLAERNITSIEPLANKVLTYVKPQQPIVLYQVDPDREGLKFAVLFSSSIPFLNNQDQLSNYNRNAIFISSSKVFYSLPKNLREQLTVLDEQKAARNNWVVFSNEKLLAKNENRLDAIDPEMTCV